jgi:chaperone required for assembly of F1-ATPase
VKRFWDAVSLRHDADGHAVLLDGRPMRLPGGGVLLIGPRALALAIAEEWRQAGGAKGGEMSFNDTPLTRLAGTARERIALDPAPTIDAIARYGETDLLCYRATEPAELVARQEREWRPWLDWLAATHRATLRVTQGVGHIHQHHDAIDRLRGAVAGFDAYALAALGIAVPALGSLVLGLALAAGRLDAAQAHVLGVLDELFQEEKWGADDEALARRAAVGADLALAERMLRLAKG